MFNFHSNLGISLLIVQLRDVSLAPPPPLLQPPT